MSQDVIELNGKRYDAITGAYLGKSHVIPKHITHQYVHGKVIDGFVRPKSVAPHKAPVKHTESAHKPTSPHPEAAAPTATPKHTHVHTPASHLRAHHPEHAKTLRRRGIAKPVTTIKPAIKAQAPAELMAKPMSAIAHKRSAYGIDSSRQERATRTNQHHTIRHFGTAATHTVAKHVPVMAVRPAPLQLGIPKPPQPKHTDIFEAAMASATSHQQPAHKVRRHRSRRQRLANTLAAIGAFLVLGGFIGYLNLPQLQLRVASVQAGFGASMPGYTPTGYALQDGVKQSGGTITLSFRSGDSYYRITQQSSDWNSQTLLDNTLALSGSHKTIQKNGQTIYLYKDNGTSAAWVNGGVRYDITGNAQLSEAEITDIAASL